MSYEDKDLWSCPKCGERFVTAHMWHSCGRFPLDDLFANCLPNVRPTYEALAKLALEVAPFHVIPQKTRVSFQLRARCAGGSPAKGHFRFHFLSRRVISHPRIVRVDSYAKDQHDHSVKLIDPSDVDHQIREWLEISLEYGEQRAVSRA